jgi:DNA adenine methylase
MQIEIKEKNNNTYIKSPLNYIGGKYKILSSLFNCFPNKINTFVDLFGGGFDVGINSNAKKIIYNDQIIYLIKMFTYFRNIDVKKINEEIENLIIKYNLSSTNIEGYNKIRSEYNKDKDILKLFILSCYSFNHQIRFNNRHEFNTSFGKNRSFYNSKIKKNLFIFCNTLRSKDIEFNSKDFTKINLEIYDKDDLIYCDPPYLITTGSYNDGNRGFKDWTEIEEIQLLNLLDKLNEQGTKFALSNVLYHKGNSNKLLIEWSKKYTINYIDKIYSNCNYQFKEKNAKTVEVLVTNFRGE